LGVTLPLAREGVARPPIEDVALPFESEAEGVREVDKVDGVVLPKVAGVVLPPFDEATDEGR